MKKTKIKKTTYKKHKELRQILGMIQKEFAALIVASQSQVTSIEVGRRTPTVEYNNRVAIATGVSAASLGNEEEALLDNEGNPYSLDFFKRYRETKKQVDSELVHKSIKPFISAFVAAEMHDKLKAFASYMKQAAEDFCALLPEVSKNLNSLHANRTRRFPDITVGRLKQDAALATMLCSPEEIAYIQTLPDEEVWFESKIYDLQAMWDKSIFS